MFYMLFEQWSFAGSAIDWLGIVWSATKLFAFVFGIIALLTVPLRSRRIALRCVGSRLYRFAPASMSVRVLGCSLVRRRLGPVATKILLQSN